jgi:hypothetical protein
VVSSPNDDGPAWKLIFARAARVTGKLKPIMPTTAIRHSGSSRSWRPRTYRSPASTRASLALTGADRFRSPERIAA